MVPVPAGRFTRVDEARVSVSPFLMSRTEIAYRDWNRVYHDAVNRGYVFDSES